MPAHRAVRGLAAAISAARYDTPKRPPRALVLQGHDGVGFLAIQELVAQQVHVVAQVPPMNHDDPDALDYVAVARAAGAAHVLVGEPEDVLDDIRDMLVAKLSWNDDGPGLEEFDCFVDTVGGKAIWEQAIHVMRDGGQVSIAYADATRSSLTHASSSQLPWVTSGTQRGPHSLLAPTSVTISAPCNARSLKPRPVLLA